MRLLRWLISLQLACACLATTAFATPTEPPAVTAAMRRQLHRAEQLILAHRNDSAGALLRGLADHLAAQGRQDSEFELWVRLRQAEALERDQQTEQTIALLLPIVDEASRLELWAIYAQANLKLALVHEQLPNWSACARDLRRARLAIAEHRLDTMRARLYLRTASFHRLRGQRDSAVYYAYRALSAAETYTRPEEKAISHFLLAILFRRSNPRRSVRHYGIAADFYQRVGDHKARMSIFMSLAEIRLDDGEPEQALLQSDSALLAGRLMAASGQVDQRHVFRMYRQRAAIYRALGRTDSAWHYLQRGYEVELAQVRQSNEARVLAIEAQYDDDKRVRQIEEQALLIEKERETRHWMMLLATMVFLCLLLVAYFNLKLRGAKQKAERQATLIKAANGELRELLERQVALQSEIHHRVNNNLQVIVSLLELQREDLADERARESLATMSNRIYGMAAIHEMLYRQDGQEVIDLPIYLRRLCQHFSQLIAEEERPTIALKIEPRSLNLETLMPLGILLHELLTNSFKYATGHSDRLTICIHLRPCDNGYRLYYRDNGPGFPTGKLRERPGGLGTYLLRSMVRQLRGRLHTSNDNGAVFEIFFLEKDVGGLQPLHVNEIES